MLVTAIVIAAAVVALRPRLARRSRLATRVTALHMQHQLVARPAMSAALVPFTRRQ